MFSALSHASRTGQKGCSNIIARKPVPQVKLYHNHYGGAVPRSNVIFWRHSVCIRKLQEPRSESTQIKMKPTLNHHEWKRNEGSKEREGKNERTYISGGEKERGGTITSYQSHTPFGVPSPHPTGMFWKQKRH